MGGIELRDDLLVVERDPNELDELAIDFLRILDDLGVEHAFVAGYVTILAGRSRATSNAGSGASTWRTSMTDSKERDERGTTGGSASDRRGAKRERVESDRIEAVKRWVAYIQEHPPEKWGPQQNSVVNAQVRAARESGLSAEQYRRVRDAGDAERERDD